MSTHRRYQTNFSSVSAAVPIKPINFQAAHYLSGTIVNWLLSDYLIERVVMTHHFTQVLTRMPEFIAERTVIEAKMATLAYLAEADLKGVRIEGYETEEPEPAHIDRYIEPLKARKQEVIMGSQSDRQAMSSKAGSRRSSRSINRSRIP